MAEHLFSRIIVGVDGSEMSAEAVQLAARLAKEYQGELLAFHAVDWYRSTALAADSMAMDVGVIIDSLREEGTALLDDAVKSAKQCGIDPTVSMPDGDPVVELLKTAATKKSTLILLGTHGRGGIGRLVLGSTAEAVLRGSTIPVMTVRGKPWPAAESPTGFKRVLLALDDSGPSDAALAVTLALPHDTQRELVICHVVSDLAAPANPVRSVDIEKYRLAQGQTLVDRAVEQARDRGIAATGLIEEGRADEVLLSRAIDKGADLVVLGSHGRRGLQRFVLGSVAERVVRTAPMPVLVIREHAT